MAAGPHRLLFYDYVEDILERRAPHREAHLARIGEWIADGGMLMAGVRGGPPQGGPLVFCRGPAPRTTSQGPPAVPPPRR